MLRRLLGRLSREVLSRAAGALGGTAVYILVLFVAHLVGA